MKPTRAEQDPVSHQASVAAFTIAMAGVSLPWLPVAPATAYGRIQPIARKQPARARSPSARALSRTRIPNVTSGPGIPVISDSRPKDAR
jgi:hypothetical protein